MKEPKKAVASHRHSAYLLARNPAKPRLMRPFSRLSDRTLKSQHERGGVPEGRPSTITIVLHADPIAYESSRDQTD